MSQATFCPAKINLFLRIEGKRPDGYHNLISLVAPLDFGDRLQMEPIAEKEDRLTITGLDLPVTADNLVLRAVRLYRERVPSLPYFHWHLQKQIPWGAGLGGGSSNAAGALRLLQQWNPQPLSEHELYVLAASLGADIPLFLRGEAGWMQGIGEEWQSLSNAERQALRGWKVLLFHPGFGISTVWAYRTLATQFTSLYGGGREGIQCLQDWQRALYLPDLLFNTLESVAGSKYIAIPSLLQHLRTELQIPCLMSGSGSACFALFPEQADIEPTKQRIQDAWGVVPVLTRWSV